MKKLLTLTLGLLLALFIQAQQRTLSGAVRDADGQPVGFATITEKDTKNAVQAYALCSVGIDR